MKDLGPGPTGLGTTPRSTSFIDASSSGFLSESAQYALLRDSKCFLVLSKMACSEGEA